MKPVLQLVQFEGEILQVLQLDSQAVQTADTDVYPEGHEIRHVLSGFRENDDWQDRQKVELVQLKHWFIHTTHKVLFP